MGSSPFITALVMFVALKLLSFDFAKTLAKDFANAFQHELKSQLLLLHY